MRIRWDKTWGIPVVTGVSSFALGAGVGYFIAYARLSKRVKEIEANQQLLRDHFESMDQSIKQSKAKITSTEAVIAEPDKEEEEMVAQHSYIVEEPLHQVEDDIPDPSEGFELVPREDRGGRIFTDFDPEPDDDWDYDVEVPKRTEERPYIIHRDEFFADELGFRQSSLTYYAGDNILCDEKDQPIYNHEMVAGTLRFGHGSRDQSIVYVRNHQFEAEYEIILDDGYYQTEVLGAVIEDEMKHGDLRHPVFRYKKD